MHDSAKLSDNILKSIDYEFASDTIWLRILTYLILPLELLSMTIQLLSLIRIALHIPGPVSFLPWICLQLSLVPLYTFTVIFSIKRTEAGYVLLLVVFAVQFFMGTLGYGLIGLIINAVYYSINVVYIRNRRHLFTSSIMTKNSSFD